MTEKNMRQRVVGALAKAGLDPISVENVVHPGTPDVNYREGWVELKKADEWPARGGPLRIEHFTPQQKVWLKRRRKNGGRAFLLLTVADDWILLLGEVAARVVGSADRPTLLAHAVKVWENRLNETELVECLQTNYPLVKG